MNPREDHNWTRVGPPQRNPYRGDEVVWTLVCPDCGARGRQWLSSLAYIDLPYPVPVPDRYSPTACIDPLVKIAELALAP